jgi:glucosylceramidase
MNTVSDLPSFLTRNTRREFLKLGAATALSASVFPLNAQSRGSISVRLTYGDQRYAAGPSLMWKATTGAPSATQIVIDPGKRYQPILGFGAAFTDASCFLFNSLSTEARQALFSELFSPTEMNLSVCRTCIGSSDYSVSVYSFDEGAVDPDLKHFSIEHDREYILPMLREARKVNPELFLFSSPWSPPGWMKDNNSMMGGTIHKRYLSAYANYFVKFLRGYEAEGVRINAVTPQNEVDTDQDSNMPASTLPQEAEVEFVGQHLGPALRRSNLQTGIWLIDHNYNLWGRAIAELDDADVRRFTNAIAWHGYVGTADLIQRVRQAHPDAEFYWTEGGPDYTDPKYATDWVKWGETYTGILRNLCRSITGWNLALDERGRPNIGPFSCGGFVTIHSQTKQVTRSGQYWATAHFSRALRRGAVRIESTGPKEVFHVAFQNPDGGVVLVLTNPGAARRAQLRVANQVADLELPGDSVATLTWS